MNMGDDKAIKEAANILANSEEFCIRLSVLFPELLEKTEEKQLITKHEEVMKRAILKAAKQVIK
jgi:hypothetical protein